MQGQSAQDWIDEAAQSIYNRATGPMAQPMSHAEKETLSEALQVGCVVIKAFLDIRDALREANRLKRNELGYPIK